MTRLSAVKEEEESCFLIVSRTMLRILCDDNLQHSYLYVVVVV